jgi:hypothetical protein
MASLETNITNLATRVATELKAHKTLINGNAADLSSLTTTNKTNLVAALNELKTVLGALISDGTTATTTTWSSNKINTQITTAISALTTGAPAAMDTLDELAAALGDDANFAATITTALGNRVRVDAAQVFTAPQQAQARANIDAASATAVGNTNADFVAVFNTGLV